MPCSLLVISGQYLKDNLAVPPIEADSEIFTSGEYKLTSSVSIQFTESKATCASICAFCRLRLDLAVRAPACC
jgi:hypothetical protein